jgi:2-C-methyl-D-erythritol 4-phosphate cytidylyltransferase
MSATPRTGAVIVAAGSSTRMGGADKLLLPLGGRPLLAHAVSVFAAHPRIERLVVVASPANREQTAGLLRQLAPGALLTAGGARRRDSVRAGLDLLADCAYVVVHDGARPLVTSELIDAVLDGARAAGAAVCALPVTDTVKRGDQQGKVRETVPRHGLWLAQTPQAFRRELLLRGHEASDLDASDDALLIELLGERVVLVPGSRENIKVTEPPDLLLAEAILQARSRSQ